jgi:hypothetical protein
MPFTEKLLTIIGIFNSYNTKPTRVSSSISIKLTKFSTYNLDSYRAC